jgi:pyruvate formate lyase activating enzyme
MRGVIFDIKRFTIHDGPGIRTTVFFKGCPAACVWCHNPEGLNRGKAIWIRQRRCLSCGSCRQICPAGAINNEDGIYSIDQEVCTFCNLCIDVCPVKAIERIDQVIESEILVEKMKDYAVYGGVTLSGGEPLYQPEFAEAVLKGLKDAGIHTCIETSLLTTKTVIDAVLPYVDLWLADLKLIDDRQHKKHVGCSNEAVLANLGYLAERKAKFTVRTPLIPGLTDTVENISGIRTFLDSISEKIPLELLAYNYLAPAKYADLGENYFDPALTPTESGHVAQLKLIARDRS